MNGDVVAMCATTTTQRARELANLARHASALHEEDLMDRLARGLDYAATIASFRSGSQVQRDHDRAWAAALVRRELDTATAALHAAGVH